MTFGEYLAKVHEMYWKHGGRWRRGQCYFNVLYETRPTMANYIRGTTLDPFYLYSEDDCKVFLLWLEEAWQLEEKWDERDRKAGSREQDVGG